MNDKVAYRNKRPSGTRWRSHQLTALSMHLRNLHTMLDFSNGHVETPYNNPMKKKKARIEGIRKNASDLKLLVFQAVRHDIMAYTFPCSLSLEKSSLLMSEAITTIESTVATVTQLPGVVEEEGVQALKRSDLFLTFHKEVTPCIQADDTARVPKEIALRCRAANCDDEETASGDEIPITYHGYVMRGSGIDASMRQVFPTIKKIARNLKECICKSVDNLISDPMFTVVATLMDTKSYRGKSADTV